MKSDDLARIIGAMTCGPYSYDVTRGRIRGRGVNEFLTKDICELFVGNLRGNAAALLALLNHAPALLRLLKAAEQAADHECDSSCNARYHTPQCQDRSHIDIVDIKMAVADVHRVIRPAKGDI